MKKRALKAGVTVRPVHAYQRRFVTEALRAGLDPLVVARLVGHADPRTTMASDRRGAEEDAARARQLGRGRFWWTTPQSSEYELAVQFSLIDGDASGVDVHVVVDSVPHFMQELDMPGESAQYASRILLNAGDSVELTVGKGPNSFSDDSTRIQWSIRKVPGVK